MPQAAQFKQCLASQILSAECILNALSELQAVVYLLDAGRPVIACFAERYHIVDSKNHFFEKTGLHQYQSSHSSIRDFSFTSHSAITNTHTGFCGGWMGFISYDFGAQQTIALSAKHQPRLFLGEFYSYLRLENDGFWYFYSTATDALEQFSFIEEQLQQKHTVSFSLQTPCLARWSKLQYQYAFTQIQNYILAGDCYQINLTQEFKAKASGHLLATAEALWQLTNAPYSGYLRVGDFELLSCSPELFIDFKVDRKIVTKPIKGTMPRYTDPILDEQSKQTLQNSEKDMAENVMIVDLLRNDLSVYAEIGSVKTPKLFNIESFNQVHHMVSEIEATLKADINPFDVLMSALPGGSITGAPKIRAMQIIEELEGASRGAYCGSLGYFNADGTGSWNILIRSIQKYQEDVSLWAGGGITIASDCDAEYQECFDKVEAMLNLLNTWHQPE